MSRQAEPPKKQSNWRKKHEDFIATIRAAKSVTQVVKDGGPLPPPPPPTYDPGSRNKSFKQQQRWVCLQSVRGLFLFYRLHPVPLLSAAVQRERRRQTHQVLPGAGGPHAQQKQVRRRQEDSRSLDSGKHVFVLFKKSTADD